MAAHGIVGHRPRRRRGLTKPNTATPPAPDLGGRLFDPDQLDRIWVSDLTYIPTEEGWLYLASVLDLASRNLLGWSMVNITTLAWSVMPWTRPSPPAAGRGWTARSSTPTAAANTAPPPASRAARGWGCGVPWAGPGSAGTAMILGPCPGRPDPCYDRPGALALTCRPVRGGVNQGARRPDGW
jgi:hypothetical protein